MRGLDAEAEALLRDPLQPGLFQKLVDKLWKAAEEPQDLLVKKVTPVHIMIKVY